MRNLIAKVLLVLMTLSGVVMPIHTYAHELTNTQDSYSIEMDVQYDSGADATFCDHCCHFSSHSLGLMQKKSSIANHQVKDALNFQKQNYAFYHQAPPHNPPISLT
jgi:hypothetical protein